MNSPLVSPRRWLVTAVAALLACSAVWLATRASSARPPAAVVVTVNSDGTFTPRHVNIRVGDTITWVNLSRTDAIVRIKDPATSPASDTCSIADNNLDHAFDGANLNEFTGPMRFAVSGVFALGPNGPGYKKVPATTLCACEQRGQRCKPDPTVVRGMKLCPDESARTEVLAETWTNPDITGVIIRLNWSDIQTGQQRYFWDDLDRQMNRAVEHGKLFTLDVRAGQEGTPLWIFTDFNPPGPVPKLTFKDWASEGQPANCGVEFPLGSPVDPHYQELYIAMINELAAHVASDSRWFQALAHVKVSGANLFSSESRLPNRCETGPRCSCNSRIWANANYTPEGLYKYYRLVGNAIYNGFFKRKSLGYQLIQAGFPRVTGPNNFEGDGTDSDLLNGTIQTETILKQMKNGRFVHPRGTQTSVSDGQLFVPQHSGIGRLPEDDGAPQCRQHQTVIANPAPARAGFPIALPLAAPGATPTADGRDGCPNPWAVNEGSINNQIIGFQTNNAEIHPPQPNGHVKGVANPADVESALWNMTINSNGVFIELYEERVWEIAMLRGTGRFAEPLTNNARRGATTAPFSKNLYTWTQELHDRRRQLSVMISNPFAADPFPNFYTFTFSKAISSPQTYHYINPSKCATTPGLNRVGMITVSP